MKRLISDARRTSGRADKIDYELHLPAAGRDYELRKQMPDARYMTRDADGRT